MNIINTHEYGNNKKHVLQLLDGSLVEIAVFKHHNAIHFCIPTQVGCEMGCMHCSTTYSAKPFMRNLSFSELCEIVSMMNESVSEKSTPLVLSLSGHGEPMMNWSNVYKCIVKYCNEFSDIYLTSIGINEIMNTVPLQFDYYPKIYFSIHGSSDEERERLIPSVKNGHVANLQQIIEFGRSYTQLGGRVVWNYMLCNTNSSKRSLERLLKICSLIEYPLEIRFTKYIDIHVDNGIKESNDNAIRTFFQSVLNEVSSNIHIRFSLLEGEDVGIACGQMRAYMQKKLVDKNLR